MKFVKIFLLIFLTGLIGFGLYEIIFMLEADDKGATTWALSLGQITCGVVGFFFLARKREDKGNRYLSADELAKKLRDRCGVEV